MKKLLSTRCGMCPQVLVFTPSVMAAPKYANVELPSTIRVIVAYNAGGSSDALARMTTALLGKGDSGAHRQQGERRRRQPPRRRGRNRLDAVSPTPRRMVRPSASSICRPSRSSRPPARPDSRRGSRNSTPLGVNVIDPNVIRLAKSSKYGSLKEALAAAKAKPGSVTVGADGPLSDDHLAMYAVAQKAGVEFSFIPYAGGAPANRALQSGEVDIAIGNVFDHIQTKDSQKDAAIMWSSRYELIPDVPTIKEASGS